MLLWTDGFDRYTNAADYALNYSANPNSHQAAAGYTGGGAARFTALLASTKTFPIAGTITSGNGVHACIIIKGGGLSSAQTVLRTVTNIATTAAVVINADGSISTQRHGDATVLATTAAGLIVVDTYYFIEYAAKYNTSGNGGYAKIWVNGTLVVNFAGTTQTGTVPSTYTGITFGKTNTGASSPWDFDDLICWDENGTDFALTQLSTTYMPIIDTLAVDANDSVQWTPSAGNNFQNVDETGFQDGDTTHNETTTVGHIDQFTVANPPTVPGYVFAVVQKTIAKITVAGAVNLRSRIISGSTTQESANRVLTTAYALYFDAYGKDPDTAAVWAVSAPAAVKIGYEYQS